MFWYSTTHIPYWQLALLAVTLNDIPTGGWNCSFVEIRYYFPVLSPVVILSGWPGSKHQLTNLLPCPMSIMCSEDRVIPEKTQRVHHSHVVFLPSACVYAVSFRSLWLNATICPTNTLDPRTFKRTLLQGRFSNCARLSEWLLFIIKYTQVRGTNIFFTLTVSVLFFCFFHGHANSHDILYRSGGKAAHSSG